MVTFAWPVSQRFPSLGANEVHIWCADLELVPLEIESLLATMTNDEQARAERFHFQKNREHYIAARGYLRAILGHYLGFDPVKIRFNYSHYGKPDLAEGFKAETIRFNVSHSNGIALYAITRGREIGVDIEQIRFDFNTDEIVHHFFSTEEIADLSRLPNALKHKAFFDCWTRKEAYIKARGEGLSLPLDQFRVSITPGAPAALLSNKMDPAEVSRWSLQSLSPLAGYAASLAVEGKGYELKCWQWSTADERR